MTETPETPEPRDAAKTPSTPPRKTAAEKRAEAQAAAAENTAADSTPARVPGVPPVEPVATTTPAADPALAAYPAPTVPPARTTQPQATSPAAHATQGAPVPPAFAKPTTASASPSGPKRRVPVGVVAAVVAAALVGGVSGAGVSLWAVSQNGGETSTTTTLPQTVTVNNPDNATNTTAVAVKAAASVVTISVSDGSEGGSGSGVILDKDGYILTNTHVVTLAGAAAKPDVKVTTNDGRLLSATIVGTDPVADLAVIKVEASDSLVPIEFADSDKLNVGDVAVAIGAPLGLAGTVTDGIISSLNRSISIASAAAPEDDQPQDDTDSEDDNGGQGPFDFWQFDIPGQEQSTSSQETISLAVIQTDAAINPGNSGGALLDAEGRLIGINVAIASAGSSSGQSGSIGVGFAIPANLAQRVADEIIENGSATHGLLGAAVLDVTEDAAQSDSGVVGASIQEVTSGGPAADAGLREGDVVIGLDGVPITGKTDLTAQVRAHAAGADVTVTYVRDGKTAEVDVTLGSL